MVQLVLANAFPATTLVPITLAFDVATVAHPLSLSRTQARLGLGFWIEVFGGAEKGLGCGRDERDEGGLV